MATVPLPEPDRGIISRREAIVEGLRRLVGPDSAIIADEDGRRAYETDALTAYRRVPLAVVLPRSTEDVSAVLKYLHAQRVPVTPRGAGTSLSGGAIPQEDCVVVCVAKMNRVLDVNFANRTARRDRPASAPGTWPTRNSASVSIRTILSRRLPRSA